MKHQPLRYAHEEGHTDVCFSPDGSKFTTCGADGDIRIWSINESEDPVHNCIGEWAVCVRQKDNTLYVATGSNDIQTLTFPDGERSSVLERFVAPINHIAVGNNSNLIALAGEDMEVKLICIKEDGEKDIKIFRDSTGPCISVALCPNSKYLACTSGDGKLRVWEIETMAIVQEINGFPKVNSFANVKFLGRSDFEPAGKLFAYPEKDTVIILKTSDWSQCCVLKTDKVTSSYSIVQFSPCGQFIAAASIEGDFIVWKVSNNLLYSDSKHVKSLPITGLVWNPLGNGEIVYTDKEGQLGMISECINKSEEEDNNYDAFNDIENELEKFEQSDSDDDENVISVEKLKKQFMETESVPSERSAAPTPRPQTPKVLQQTAFMPSSTPEHLSPRYLCWNDIGIIRYYNSNDDSTTDRVIEVEFHDSSFHNSLMLQNFQGYFMGTLSKKALVVANSSQISVIPLGFKEWSLKCEEYEEIILLASSEDLICFATNNYIIRICSIFGTQRATISSPGPVVSMSAFKNYLLFAYHSANPRNGDQCIEMKLVKFEGLTMQSTNISSALGPDSTLFWVGFSDLGTPAMMDSLGMLSLYPKTSNIWIPFCETTKYRKNPSDGFFVTAVSESNQTIIGIKCKGTLYPGFIPRPTVCEIPMQPPFAEFETEKTQMELDLFAWSNLQREGVEKKVKETGLKLFALACRNDFNERALEVIEILSNPQLLNLAVKYATKLDKKRLVDNLTNLTSKLMEDDNSYGLYQDNKMQENVPKLTKKVTLSRLSSKRKISELKEVNTNVTGQEDSINTSISLSFINDDLDNSQGPGSNPFLKSKKMENPNENPLSLTSTTAGVNHSQTKENKKKNLEVSEKRKHPETESEKPKEKQRRLEKFMLKKN